MKKIKILIVVLCSLLILASCSKVDNKTHNQSSVDYISESTVDEKVSSREEDINLDKKLLENKKNTAGNGYIVINDENDYPEGIKNLRFFKKKSENRYDSYDFFGNEIFEVESNIYPMYSEGLALIKNSEDLYGYIDKDGKTVIEPQFTDADFFRNGTAKVETPDGEFYIDKKGKQSDNKAYEGFKGSMNEGYHYGKFTGKYSSYVYLKDGTYPVYGYVDAKGNHKDLEEAESIGTFINGYAVIDKINSERVIDEEKKSVYIKGGTSFKVIDENFNIVADFSDFDNGAMYDKSINLYEEEIDNMCGTDYIFDGSYMIYVPVYSNKMKVIKIAPELYKEKK